MPVNSLYAHFHYFTCTEVAKFYHHCSIQCLAVLKSPEEAIIPFQLLFTLVFNNVVLLHTVFPPDKLVTITGVRIVFLLVVNIPELDDINLKKTTASIVD